MFYILRYKTSEGKNKAVVATSRRVIKDRLFFLKKEGAYDDRIEKSIDLYLIIPEGRIF